MNGAYTDKTVDEQISSQKESVDALTLGSKTLPSILIGGALISLLAGFYVYYQNGGVVSLDDPGEGQAAETTESDSDENDKESDSDEEVTGDEDKREMAIPEDETSEED